MPIGRDRQYAVFVRDRPDLRWKDLEYQRIQVVPYNAAFGNKNPGSFAKCRGCRRSIVDKHELRIQVTGMFSPPNSGPYPGKNTFCLSAECIDQAIRRDKQFYPPFDGRVSVAEDVNNALKGNLPSVDGIEWLII